MNRRALYSFYTGNNTADFRGFATVLNCMSPMFVIKCERVTPVPSLCCIICLERPATCKAKGAVRGSHFTTDLNPQIL